MRHTLSTPHINYIMVYILDIYTGIVDAVSQLSYEPAMAIYIQVSHSYSQNDNTKRYQYLYNIGFIPFQ